MYKVHSYPAHLFGAFPLAQNLSYTFDFSRMTWVNKNCDHFCKNFPSLEHSGLRSKVSNISNGTLLIAKLAQDEEKIRRMNISQFWGLIHTPSPRVPAPPSLPRLITSYMNSSLKLIAYKRVATSCFEALTNYIFSNWNCSLNTKYWWLMIKIQIGEQTWFDRSPPYFSSLQFIILTSTNAFEMLQHIFKRKYSTPSSSSLAHIITKPDSSNKSPSESGRFTAKCNRIPLLLPAHYHVSPTYTCIHDEQNGREWCRL